MGSVQRERRQYERRQAGGRRAADPASPPQATVIKPPAPMPTMSPHRLCRGCGSSLIERSRRGPIERVVTWICGLEHVRETIPFPRMLHRLRP